MYLYIVYIFEINEQTIKNKPLWMRVVQCWTPLKNKSNMNYVILDGNNHDFKIWIFLILNLCGAFLFFVSY